MPGLTATVRRSAWTPSGGRAGSRHRLLDRDPALLEQHGAGHSEGDPALVRSRSRTPSLRSSLPMAAESGGWAMPRRAAARVKFSSSATAME